MPKHRILLAAPPGLARDRFRTRILREAAPALLAAVPDLAAASACLVDATPATPPWQRPGEPAAPSAPPFDAVLDLWGPGTALAAPQFVRFSSGCIARSISVGSRPSTREPEPTMSGSGPRTTWWFLSG